MQRVIMELKGILSTWESDVACTVSGLLCIALEAMRIPIILPFSNNVIMICRPDAFHFIEHPEPESIIPKSVIGLPSSIISSSFLYVLHIAPVQ